MFDKPTMMEFFAGGDGGERQLESDLQYAD